MERKLVITGSICILLGIILGAFGAHGLKDLLKNDPEVLKKIGSFETGVRYQMYTGFSLLIMGINHSKFSFSFKSIYIFWLLGTILFSCSIYFLTIQSAIGVSLKFLGPVTPLGGLFMIIGWFVFLYKVIKTPINQQQESKA